MIGLTHVVRFLRSEDGATAVEYGLIAAGISVVIIASITVVGTELNETLTFIGNRLNSAQTN